MLNKVKKIISIFLIIIIICLGNRTLATTMHVNDIKPEYTIESARIKVFGRELFGIVRNIAAISSVVILAFVGLKIILGSVDQKAEYKKSLMPIIIGICIVLGATTIVSAIWKL